MRWLIYFCSLGFALPALAQKEAPAPGPNAPKCINLSGHFAGTDGRGNIVFQDVTQTGCSKIRIETEAGETVFNVDYAIDGARHVMGLAPGMTVPVVARIDATSLKLEIYENNAEAKFSGTMVYSLTPSKGLALEIMDASTQQWEKLETERLPAPAGACLDFSGNYAKVQEHVLSLKQTGCASITINGLNNGELKSAEVSLDGQSHPDPLDSRSQRLTAKVDKLALTLVEIAEDGRTTTSRLRLGLNGSLHARVTETTAGGDSSTSVMDLFRQP